jgi:hypothetical protein
MAKLWEAIPPGFTWLTAGNMVLGLVELFLYGLYVALVFVPLFNYFEAGNRAAAEKRDSPGAAGCREATAR